MSWCRPMQSQWSWLSLQDRKSGFAQLLQFCDLQFRQGVWHKPTTEQELLEILASFTPTTKYRIVGGNTGTGVFKHDEESYDAFVDINHVVELKQQSQEPMVLGANVSITDAIHFFGAAGEDLDKDQ